MLLLLRNRTILGISEGNTLTVCSGNVLRLFFEFIILGSIGQIIGDFGHFIWYLMGGFFILENRKGVQRKSSWIFSSFKDCIGARTSILTTGFWGPATVPMGTLYFSLSDSLAMTFQLPSHHFWKSRKLHWHYCTVCTLFKFPFFIRLKWFLNSHSFYDAPPDSAWKLRTVYKLLSPQSAGPENLATGSPLYLER